MELYIDESMSSMSMGSDLPGLFSTLSLLKVADNRFGDAVFIGACLSVLEYVDMFLVLFSFFSTCGRSLQKCLLPKKAKSCCVLLCPLRH